MKFYANIGISMKIWPILKQNIYAKEKSLSRCSGKWKSSIFFSVIFIRDEEERKKTKFNHSSLRTA